MLGIHSLRMLSESKISVGESDKTGQLFNAIGISTYFRVLRISARLYLLVFIAVFKADRKSVYPLWVHFTHQQPRICEYADNRVV